MTTTAATHVSDPDARADIGVIGGSGFYTFLDDATTVTVETPFGPPSDPLVVGEVGGRAVAFLARHGAGHRLPPHRIDYRANLWALRAVGVRQVLAPCAVGSLRPDRPAGTIVVPDQVVDRTWGRRHTLYEEDGGVVHVSFADPYCPRGRSAAATAAAGLGRDIDPDGTMVVINGPRFSSRAEAAWHRSLGGSVIGMTGMPEAAIARELALCYTSVCLVTDLDAGIGPDDAVTHSAVLEVFAANIAPFKDLIRATIAQLPVDAGDDGGDERCACRRALDGLHLPFTLPA